MAIRVRIEAVKRRNSNGTLTIVGYRLRYGKNSTLPGVWEKLSDAKDKAIQEEQRLLNEGFDRVDRRASIADDFQRYLAECAAGIHNKKGEKLEENTITSYKQHCGFFLRCFTTRDDITEKALRDWMLKVGNLENSDWTKSNKLKDARTFLNWMYRRKLIRLKPDEVIGITRPEAKPRYFLDSELDDLERVAVGTEFHLALRLAYMAGLRKSEVLAFDTSMVQYIDNETAEYRIPQNTTKNDHPAVVPLCAEIVALLGGRHQWRPYAGWKSRKFEVAWWKLKAAAEIKEKANWLAKRFSWGQRMRECTETESAHFHDLRHTFCRHKIEGGMRFEILAKITRHESLDVLRRTYGHFQPSLLHDEMQKADAMRRKLRTVNLGPL